MIKRIITEISEEDFRKLNLKVRRNERVVVSENVHKFEMVEKSLNEILDNEIKYCLESGYESDLKNLKIPVTIAIHEEPTEEDYKEFINTYKGLLTPDEARNLCRHEWTYLDKFMNCFTGAQTFQIGWGISHLYSTRDYYESHEDYWRVSKKETKVIYRVKLSDKWLDKFVLKHKTIYNAWPYDKLPEGVNPKFKIALFS